jgi:hypothetical protein
MQQSGGKSMNTMVGEGIAIVLSIPLAFSIDIPSRSHPTGFIAGQSKPCFDRVRKPE